MNTIKRIIKLISYALPFCILTYLLLKPYSRYLYEIIPAWLVMLLFWLACMLLGIRLNNWLKLSERIPIQLSLFFFLGSSTILLVLVILLFAHLFYQWLLVAIILFSIIINLKYAKELMQACKAFKGEKLFFIILFFQVLIILFAGSTPVFFYDALIYQLAIPASYLQHHGYTYNPYSLYTSFPVNMNLFFAIPLSFNSDIAAQMLSFLFAIMIFIGIKEFVSTAFDSKSGMLASLIFITTPVVALTSLVAAVDLGLAFYALIAFMLLYQYIKTEEKKLFYWSSIASGIALGIKYLFLMYLIPVVLIAIFFFARDWNVKIKFSRFIIFIAILGFVFSPWAIKNLIIHHDPVYPFFSSVTSGRTEVMLQLFGEKSLHSIILSLKDYLLFPVIMNFKPIGSAGILGCFFLIMLPWVILSGRKSSDVFKFSLMISLIGVVLFTFTPHSLRYFLVIIPFLCIVYGIALSEESYLLHKAGKYFTYFCIILNLLMMLNPVLNVPLMLNPAIAASIFDYSAINVDRTTFLSRFVENYQAAEYLNKNTPASSRILLVGEARTFYINRECYYNLYVQPVVIEQWIKESSTMDNFLDLLNKKNVHYVLFNYYEMSNIVKKLRRDNYFTLQPPYSDILNSFISNHLILVYQDQFISIFRIK